MTDLTCSQARALVSDYIDGELAPSLAEALEGHLLTCPSCPPLYASLVASLADLKATEIRGVVVDRLVERVVAAVTAMGDPAGT